MSNKQPTIPFLDFGGVGDIIHFAHANGYPPEGYQQFIQPFTTQHQIIASKFRPLWGGRQPKEAKTWSVYADDLIRFMDEKGIKGVIGMGHSMGGVISVLAALKRPDLFSQLVLIDPVIFAKNYTRWNIFFPTSLLKRIVPPAKLSANRRDIWASREEVYESWRQKRVFKRFSDEVLQDYINAAIVPNGKGEMTLAFSKEWETQVYITAPYIFDDLLKLQLPIIVIRGEKTDVITPVIWEEWKKTQPKTQFIEFKGAGHLVPMEFPTELAQMIMDRL